MSSLFFSLIIVVILAADAITKHLILYHIMTPAPPVMWQTAPDAWMAQTLPVTPFFNITLVWNRGVSFGMLNSGTAPDWQPFALIGVTLAIVVALMIWATRTTDRLTRTALALICGGALGNSIDRLRFGAVVDFLDFHALGWHWPAFNVADSCIVIGAVLLFLQSLLHDSKRAGQSVDAP